MKAIYCLFFFSGCLWPINALASNILTYQQLGQAWNKVPAWSTTDDPYTFYDLLELAEQESANDQQEATCSGICCTLPPTDPRYQVLCGGSTVSTTHNPDDHVMFYRSYPLGENVTRDLYARLLWLQVYLNQEQDYFRDRIDRLTAEQYERLKRRRLTAKLELFVANLRLSLSAQDLASKCVKMRTTTSFYVQLQALLQVENPTASDLVAATAMETAWSTELIKRYEQIKESEVTISHITSKRICKQVATPTRMQQKQGILDAVSTRIDQSEEVSQELSGTLSAIENSSKEHQTLVNKLNQPNVLTDELMEFELAIMRAVENLSLIVDDKYDLAEIIKTYDDPEIPASEERRLEKAILKRVEKVLTEGPSALTDTRETINQYHTAIVSELDKMTQAVRQVQQIFVAQGDVFAIPNCNDYIAFVDEGSFYQHLKPLELPEPDSQEPLDPELVTSRDIQKVDELVEKFGACMFDLEQFVVNLSWLSPEEQLQVLFGADMSRYAELMIAIKQTL